MEEEKFKRGFNNGYLMSQHRPDLISILGTCFSAPLVFTRGFLAGMKEYEKAKERDKQLAQIQNLRKRSKDVDKDLDYDIDER